MSKHKHEWFAQSKYHLYIVPISFEGVGVVAGYIALLIADSLTLEIAPIPAILFAVILTVCVITVIVKTYTTKRDNITFSD